MKYLQNIKIAYMTACVIFMLIGIMLMGFPEFSMVAVCYLIGIMFIILGVIKIMAYFSQEKYNIAFQFDLALGILSVIVGICTVIHHNWIISILPIIIGIMIIAEIHTTRRIPPMIPAIILLHFICSSNFFIMSSFIEYSSLCSLIISCIGIPFVYFSQFSETIFVILVSCAGSIYVLLSKQGNQNIIFSFQTCTKKRR